MAPRSPLPWKGCARGSRRNAKQDKHGSRGRKDHTYQRGAWKARGTRHTRRYSMRQARGFHFETRGSIHVASRSERLSRIGNAYRTNNRIPMAMLHMTSNAKPQWIKKNPCFFPRKRYTRCYILLQGFINSFYVVIGCLCWFPCLMTFLCLRTCGLNTTSSDTAQRDSYPS